MSGKNIKNTKVISDGPIGRLCDNFPRRLGWPCLLPTTSCALFDKKRARLATPRYARCFAGKGVPSRSALPATAARADLHGHAPERLPRHRDFAPRAPARSALRARDLQVTGSTLRERPGVRPQADPCPFTFTREDQDDAAASGRLLWYRLRHPGQRRHVLKNIAPDQPLPRVLANRMRSRERSAR